MSRGNDFELTPGDRPGGELSPAEQGPVIVIEYRDRGLASRLMPAALILLAAIAIASYQRKTPVARLVPRPRSTPESPPSNPLADRDRKPPAIAPTSDDTPGDPPPGSTSPAADPVAMTETIEDEAETPEAEVPPPSPFELGPADGLQLVERPPAIPIESAPPIASRPTSDDLTPIANPAEIAPGAQEEVADANEGRVSEEIQGDIEREAEELDARRQEMEGLKSRAKTLLLDETLQRVHSVRVPFRDDLKDVIIQFRGEPRKAGEEIERLCLRYGKEVHPQVRRAYNSMLRIAPKRWSRQSRVEMMRGIGIPEPLILDLLCRDYDKLLNTRGGPRDEYEVRLRAARALLAIPLSTATRSPST